MTIHEAHLLFICTLLCTLTFCNGYPDLSWDYSISEADLDPLYRTYINEQRELTDGMPRVCRKDICYEESTYDFRKGTFHWPEIISGQQVDLRCPFSFNDPVYTTRACSVDSQGVAIWFEADFESVCPDPPLAQLLDEIEYEYYYITPLNQTSFYRDMLSKVVEVFTVYRDAPVDSWDVERLVFKLWDVVPLFLNSPETIYPETVQDYLTVMDTLMDDDLREYLAFDLLYYNLGKRFRDDISQLSQFLPTPISEVMNNLAIYSININSSHDIVLNLPNVFSLEVNENVTVKTPNVTIKIHDTPHILEQVNSSILGLTLLKYSYLFTRNATWIEVIYFNDTRGNSSEQEISHLEEKYLFESRGSLILLTSESEYVDLNDGIDVVYSSHTCDVTAWDGDCLHEQPFCVTAGTIDFWSSGTCEVTDTLDHSGFTSCACSGIGAFTIFTEDNESGREGIEAPEMMLPDIIEGDISVFLGFPYKKEVEILGTVLGSVSLVCLLATLASYGMFRCNRRGSPTTILIHLCVALTVLSVLLLIVQYLGDAMTRTGCTVCNVLRYYIVFVSLMWNAVEAFNMYLMLLKVFDSNVRKFAWKAGVIAWGIPLLMVTICFAVNKKSFNGHFAIISEKDGQCAFQCQLNQQMIYYAYLIPLAVIILHNMIVFAFVLRAIVKHGQKLGKSKKRIHIIQLVGAVATLTLLGVPWVFSAFGAINATANQSLLMLQGIFQVVFVVFVNLQGCFIFAFHCARNAQIRQSWSSIIQSAVSVTRTSSMGQSADKTSSLHQAKGKEEVTEPGDKGTKGTENIEIKEATKDGFDQI